MVEIRNLFLNYKFDEAAKKHLALNLKLKKTNAAGNQEEQLKLLYCEMRLDLWQAKSYFKVGDYKTALDLATKHVNAYLKSMPVLKEQFESARAKP